MTAHSFLSVLLSNKSGQVDVSRDHTLTGMERHARSGRTDGEQSNVGYPMRTIINNKFHYIRNFRPNRWPAGDPPKNALYDFDSIATNTYAAFSDVDQGPTKAWIATHRYEKGVKNFFQLAFGKRPERELYDLILDPYELRNVAEEPAYVNAIKKLDAQLIKELKATNDPRMTNGGDEFDSYNTMKKQESVDKSKTKSKE